MLQTINIIRKINFYWVIWFNGQRFIALIFCSSFNYIFYFFSWRNLIINTKTIFITNFVHITIIFNYYIIRNLITLIRKHIIFTTFISIYIIYNRIWSTKVKWVSSLIKSIWNSFIINQIFDINISNIAYIRKHIIISNRFFHIKIRYI